VHLHKLLGAEGRKKSTPRAKRDFHGFQREARETCVRELQARAKSDRFGVGFDMVKTKMLKDVDVVGMLEAACDRRAIDLEWKEWGGRAGF